VPASNEYPPARRPDGSGWSQPDRGQPDRGQPGQFSPGQFEPGRGQRGARQAGQFQPGRDQPGQFQPAQGPQGKSQPGPRHPAGREPGPRHHAGRQPGTRQPHRASTIGPGRLRSTRQALLTISAVLVIAAIGAWALLATKAKSPVGPPAAAAPGSTRPAAHRVAAPSAKVTATFSLTWVGDMTFGTLNEWPPDGTGSLIAAMKPFLHSDLTVGNLESALGDLSMSKCSPRQKDCYQFEAPPYTAKDLKRDGFSAVNVANNHTLDAGPAGEASTDRALRAAGLRWAGRPGQITYLTRNGIRIALLGFAPWSYDANALDIPAAESLVRQAKQHAKVVIVMEHLGGEGDDYRHVKPGEEYFLGQDRGNSIAFTHGVIDAGADLVMGSGPHVLRGFQWYHGHLIAYSLGNFSGYNTLGLDPYTSVSAILHVTLNARGKFVKGSITPLRLVAPGVPERDPDRTATRYVNSLSRADFSGNGAVRLSAAGKIELP
jgi:poly-gamma-glutamate capsule biosynthesis protein CapA/YwtB (metallophosphatase superfamily)